MEKNRAFKKLVIGQMFANIGDIIYTIAVVSSVFTLTNSALAASLAPVIMTVGTVFSGLLTPVLINYATLTDILRKTQLFKTFILIGLAVYLNLKVNNENLFFLYTFIFSISFLDGCAEPISRALIPHYAAKSYLIRANSIFSTMLQIVSIGGWAVGSSLLIIFSIPGLIWINVGIFAIATFAFWYLPKVSTTDNAEGDRWKHLISGWQEIRKQPIIFTIVSMDILESIANTAWISAVVLVFVKDVLHVSENWWGYINATYFLGATLGSMLVFYLNVMVDKNKSKIIVISSVLGGVITLLVALGGNPFLILVYSILIGVFLQVKNIPQATILQQKVDRNKLTSVYAATGILNTATFSLSSLMMGAVADALGVNIVFVLSGILLFVVAFIAKNKRKLLDG